ncbi:MAG: tRNA 2-selenouridine(34) synthase MnmH [Salibacteraceae bacterium]
MTQVPSKILLNGLPNLDVRSPAEFEQGHVPGAISFPIFSNDERHQVGLTYKQTGREEALKVGLDFVDPKMRHWIEKALNIAPERKVNMYCWRGGMRSGSMAWLLKTAGFEVNLIDGGYKTWRKEVLDVIAQPYEYINLAGYTGVGKTELLHSLKSKGEQIIDLEALANHKGSVFGTNQTPQPTTEHFENMLAFELLSHDRSMVIWIEDESKSIGSVYLNHLFYNQLTNAPIILINRPIEQRINYLCTLYGKKTSDILKAGFKRIERRIGGDQTKAALNYINTNNLAAAARIALRYYDKTYLHSMSRLNRKPMHSQIVQNNQYAEAADQLIKWKKKKNSLIHA